MPRRGFDAGMPEGLLGQADVAPSALGAHEAPEVVRLDVRQLQPAGGPMHGAPGDFHATALDAGAGPLWVCAGACDALALLAAGIPRVVAIFGVQGWRWDWAREVRKLVFALDADAAGQQPWRTLAQQAALRGKRVAVLPAAAYGGHKDASAAWGAGGGRGAHCA